MMILASLFSGCSVKSEGATKTTGETVGVSATLPPSDLKDYEIIQGDWQFQRPGHESYPDAIEYGEMTLSVHGEDYVVVKDGEEVDRGRLVNDGNYLGGESGHIYLFDHLWATGVNGNELTIDYNIEDDWGWIELVRIPGDADAEWARFRSQKIESVSILKTDRKKRPVYEIEIDNSGSYPYMKKGHAYFKPDAEHQDEIMPKVMDILQKYELYRLGNTDETLDNCTDATYFRVKTEKGLTLFVCRENRNLPKNVDRAGQEISALYEEYLSFNEYQSKPRRDITGTWKNEEEGITYRFKADGTYVCTSGNIGKRAGTYQVVENYVLGCDLVEGAFLAMGSRWAGLGEFENLQIQADGSLYASYMVFDGDAIGIRFTKN